MGLEAHARCDAGRARVDLGGGSGGTVGRSEGGESGDGCDGGLDERAGGRCWFYGPGVGLWQGLGERGGKQAVG